MKPLREMTDEQFRRHVFGLLEKYLGRCGMARFSSTFCTGTIDYTRDRHLWLDGVSMDEILKESGDTPSAELLDKEAS